MRFSVLLLGAPATTRANFAKVKHKTILGLSLNVVANSGQYFPDKLINLSANRWAVRPELALSQPIGKSWQIDVYTGLWLFTNNNQFYTGQAVRTQNPMGAFQAHLSYNIQRTMWVAFDATFYAGGQSSVNSVVKDDRASNARLGATFVFPVWKRNSFKLAISKGAIVRIGADFTTISIGWQRSWFGKQKSKG
jgi:Putative MetA-pathway of phenol degradation